MSDKHLTEAEMSAEFHRSVCYFHSASDLHSLFNDKKSKDDLDRDTGWMFAMDRIGIAPHAIDNDYE